LIGAVDNIVRTTTEEATGRRMPLRLVLILAAHNIAIILARLLPVVYHTVHLSRSTHHKLEHMEIK
jgi:hypothetical protein